MLATPREIKCMERQNNVSNQPSLLPGFKGTLQKHVHCRLKYKYSPAVFEDILLKYVSTWIPLVHNLLCIPEEYHSYCTTQTPGVMSWAA